MLKWMNFVFLNEQVRNMLKEIIPPIRQEAD